MMRKATGNPRKSAHGKARKSGAGGTTTRANGSKRSAYASAAVPRILHLHSTFAAGGKELRSVRLINAFGTNAAHTIVSGVPERREAAGQISPRISVQMPDAVSYTHLRAHETRGNLVCRLLL